MASLLQSVELARLNTSVVEVDHAKREVRATPIFLRAARKKKGCPGPNCKCEACSALYMQRTKDKRMKAMMPGNVDMGNRGFGKKVKAKLDYGTPKPKVKQVAPPKSTAKKIKPSQLMHDKGMILQ